MSGNAGVLTDHYVSALAFFGETVQDIADHEWDLPTPCTEWDVRAVVAHVITGEAHLSDLLSGDTGTVTEVDASIVGVSPMSVWRGTALRAIAAARADGVVEGRWQHQLGELAGTQLLGWRISENLVHAWDVSLAVGRERGLPDELAETCLEFWWPVALELGASGDYAAAAEPPADAAAGERLLYLLGRR